MQKVKNRPIIPVFLSTNLWGNFGSPRVWKKKFRNKIIKDYGVFYEHVYEFTPTSSPNYELEYGEKKAEITIYTNKEGYIIWSLGKNSFSFCNDHSPEVVQDRVRGTRKHYSNQEWIGWKKNWGRTYSDVKFLLHFEKTQKDFRAEVRKNRDLYILFPSKDVEEAVWARVREVEHGCSQAIGSYSGPGSLSVKELKKLGCKTSYNPPTKKFAESAPTDSIHENFNWGTRKPDMAEWFRYAAGYHYNGNKGCNSGWVWYS